jgi:hypothetical protein
MPGQYILDAEGNPIHAPDLLTWGKWLEAADRHIGNWKSPQGTYVSTVFLGLDHQWGDGPPVLWETMIFGGKDDQFQERYTSRADALAGHERAVQLVKDSEENL